MNLAMREESLQWALAIAAACALFACAWAALSLHPQRDEVQLQLIEEYGNGW